VRDGDGRRAAWRSSLTLPARPDQLELSDLQVACGPAPIPEDPVLRINPNPAAQVPAADPVGVYFEAYGLRPGEDGLARFTIEYTVRSIDRDQRPWISRLFSRHEKIPTISTTRSDQNVGDLRRQFVTIPAQSLPPGHYRLDVRLRDDIAGVEAHAETRFQKI
jgi:hypothetical protein